MLDYIRIHLNALIGDKRGVTAVEYGVIAGVIVALIAAGFGALGTTLSTKLGSITF